MSSSISIRRKIVAVLLLPFLMVLAGCGKFHADFDIQDVDTINVNYDFAMDEEFAEGLYSSADEFCTTFEDRYTVAGETAPSAEPYEENGQLGCRITGTMTSENFGGGFSLTEADGEYHLVIDGSESVGQDLNSPEMEGFEIDFRMTFTFPGKILESQGGQVDGNSVTFTDLNELAAGIDIRADASGFPWVIVVIVVLVLGFFLLLLLAAIAFFVIRARRNKGGGSGGSGMPVGYGAAPSGAAAGTMPPAAPQGGQQWGQQPGGQQGGQPDGQQWGQASPPPAPPQPGGQQGGQQWGQASPPPAPRQGGQQGGQQWGQQPGKGQQPPQNPSW
ncbi:MULTISPECIES: LppM family (lipo)protein [unclassified Brachybacterium]|uniref:LppM family (lipo)protein n=1 Tax=unclassified Brachybacterium TaxID=2623841 RepID=UPI00402ADA72